MEGKSDIYEEVEKIIERLRETTLAERYVRMKARAGISWEKQVEKPTDMRDIESASTVAQKILVRSGWEFRV